MPSSLALLLGLPIREESFRARLMSGDFLSRYRSYEEQEAWRKYRGDVGRPFSELADLARSLDVAVFEDATLETVSHATGDIDTVVIISHWKGPEVRPDDLALKEVDGYVARANSSQSPVALLMRARFAKLQPSDLTGVRAALTDYINDPHALTAIFGDNDTVKAGSFAVMSHNRDALDDLFGAALRPGNRIELADGLHSKEEFGAAIAPSFRGTLDLTTCTSTHLSDFLGRTVRGRYISVQFDKPLIPSEACLLLGPALALHNSGMTYRRARFQALIGLEQDLAEANSSFLRRWFGSVFRKLRQSM